MLGRDLPAGPRLARDQGRRRPAHSSRGHDARDGQLPRAASRQRTVFPQAAAGELARGASFKLFGHRNEWTARLPSVLCVLAVALAFITVARASLGANGSLIAALIWMANFGMIEKGRLIEIEALYVSLFGLALICWLSWWQQRRSVWLTWTVPWIFLGLGLLAKGPLHLFFFYAVVIAVLYRERRTAEALACRSCRRPSSHAREFSRRGRFHTGRRCGGRISLKPGPFN